MINQDFIRQFKDLQRKFDNLEKPEVEDNYIDLDFTGTAYDTKAECNGRGLRFSDSATPFPTDLEPFAVSGSWTHSSGNGWQPASATDDEGPAIIFPLVRGANFEITATLDLTGDTASYGGRVRIGYLSASNHVGAYATTVDDDGANIEYDARLITNDGDDTFTTRYNGTSLTGAATRTLAFRSLTGCVGVYDDQDDAWHYYQGTQSTGIAYTAAYGFVDVTKIAGQTLSTLYIASLKLVYLT